MQRYFLELAYKGTNYSGFQIQENAVTIQSEVTKALETFYRTPFELVGSSRTDAGVHAFQNFFHFNVNPEISITQKQLYHLNAILPADIVLKNVFPVSETMHCRFNAVSREYKYFIHQTKNPFLQETAWYYPYKLNVDLLNKAAQQLQSYNDYTSFSKKNTQVKTFICNIYEAVWTVENECLVFNVKANRFLRGMVRALVATMLKIGTDKISVEAFTEIIKSKDCSNTDFSAPAQGLFLSSVNF
ncbi:MAG: tRNA pseudouridine(38-40) synthase TruA [Chitinophaga sp.]|jgi:tRNA pseudouridine38-40 synthase|nr:tRNA pseudouridine(38-40) synthase TruA [Chitinophaga sp.]